VNVQYIKKGKKMKKIPQFNSDAECAEFWDNNSIVDYIDEFEKADDIVFEKPQKQVVTLRLEREFIQKLKAMAHHKGLPYSSLIRMWLVEKANEEVKTRKQFEKV